MDKTLSKQFQANCKKIDENTPKNYAWCVIRWHDDNDPMLAHICIGYEGDTEEHPLDDEIFFYVDNTEQLKDLCDPDNKGDFYIEDFIEYRDEVGY